jgi:2,3-bisphosphoglycerate-dependent phosphoglycerate mutase
MRRPCRRRPPTRAIRPCRPLCALGGQYLDPHAASLADVSVRLLPYWYDVIVPDLRAGGCVLVVSHGNTLRALVKHLESISDEQIAELEIPTGIPLVYQLGPDLRPDALGGQYLDPHAARHDAEAHHVLAQDRS